MYSEERGRRKGERATSRSFALRWSSTFSSSCTVVLKLLLVMLDTRKWMRLERPCGSGVIPSPAACPPPPERFDMNGLWRGCANRFGVKSDCQQLKKCFVNPTLLDRAATCEPIFVKPCYCSTEDSADSHLYFITDKLLIYTTISQR